MVLCRPLRRSFWITVPPAVALLIALSGCGGNSSNVSVAPSSIDRCGVSLSGGGSPIPAGGGTGTVTVNVERECSWSARSESSWISLAGGQGQGQGPATITFSVQPNPNGSSRRGSVAVEQQKVEIAQEAAPCRYEVSPPEADMAAAGGAASIGVSALGGCSWTAQSGVAWLSVEPRNGQGAGTVQIAVAANGAGARSANVTIAGTAVQVRQAAAAGPSAPSPSPSPAPSPAPSPSPTPPPSQGCRFDVAPTRLGAGVLGDQFKVDVKAPSGCAWTATSQAQWIVATGGDGTGDGEVRLLVAPNVGGSRTGTVMIAGTSVTVQQDGVLACSYTLKPRSLEVKARQDEAEIEVKTRDGCSWTASSPVPWVTIQAGSHGSGDGKVGLRIDENSGPPRSTTLIVAGEPFSLTQEAAKK